MVEKVICLDIGCGSGRSYAFNPHCPVHSEAVLLDVEPPSESVKGALTPSRASIHFIVADACRLPIRNSVINVAYAIHVIEHTDSAARFLYEVKRVLKTGGELHLEFPTVYSVDLYRDPTHKQKLCFLKIWLLAKKLGFTVILRHRIGSLFPARFRRFINFVINLLADHLQLTLTKQ